MTKPTKQQILDCNDIQQLHEWAAKAEYDNGNKSDEVTNAVTGNPYSKTRYEPCSPTVEGKAQAIELAEKYGMELDFEGKCVAIGNELTFWFIDKNKRNKPFWQNENFADTWQIAAVKLGIISEIKE